MKKIRAKKNDLLNDFNCDHKQLSKEYLKSCNDFFNSKDQKNKYDYKKNKKGKKTNDTYIKNDG